MKKTILSLLMLTLYFINLNGQINKGINFQGVARSDNGIILANKIVTLRLSIKNDSINGVTEYQEIKSITTNTIGLFSVVVGSKQDRNIISIGNFENINWSNTEKFLEVEVDLTGELYFSSLGIQKINYVPYAFYADKVDAVNINGIVGVKKGGTGFDNLKDFKIMAALDKVNNTPDSNKPISENTLLALSEKLTKSDTAWLSKRIDTKLNKWDTNHLSNRIDLKLTKSDTLILSTRVNQKLNSSDTVRIFNKINQIPVLDTTSLSQRINLKLNKIDTNYLSNRINQKLNLSDTTKIYNKINQIPVLDTTSLSQRINLKLNKIDTNYLSNRINQKLNLSDTTKIYNKINQIPVLDTTSLSQRINLKLNKSDTNYLSNRIDFKLNKFDTNYLSNRINQKLSLDSLTAIKITNALNYIPVPNDYGNFYDTAKQSTSIATATVVKFNYMNFANNIAITNNTSGLPTRITAKNAGLYNIKYTLQFIKTDAANDEVSIWLRRNSSAYPNTNNTYTILGSGIKNTISNSFFVALGNDDYVEIYFSIKNVNTSLTSVNPQLTPSRPATPAATVSIQRIN
jgi:hypothetical protein